MDAKLLSRNNKLAFTLIELLVVIAITGILAAVVTTSLSSSRQKATDASKTSGVKEVAKAMELDRNQITGFFSTYTNASAAAIGMVEYISPWPTGVVFLDNTSDNTTYCVYAQLDNSSFGNYIISSGTSSGYMDTVPSLGDCTGGA